MSIVQLIILIREINILKISHSIAPIVYFIMSLISLFVIYLAHSRWTNICSGHLNRITENLFHSHCITGVYILFWKNSPYYLQKIIFPPLKASFFNIFRLARITAHFEVPEKGFKNSISL